MKDARSVIIMAKAPVMGRVKTRLAGDIGAVTATWFYRHELARLVRVLGRDKRWETYLAVTPDHAISNPVWPIDVGLIAQGKGDLGSRMLRSISAMPPGPVVVVGSDIPTLGQRHVAEAFAVLGRHDVVFCPSSDGGYNLIGITHHRLAVNLFTDVRWSTSYTLDDTMANLAGLREVFLDLLEDIDCGADYAFWKALVRGTPCPIWR